MIEIQKNSYTIEYKKTCTLWIRYYYIFNNIELLTRKVVYPYDYVTSIDKFNETQLPPKKEFYSKLYNEDISDNDYEHAQNVWKNFKRKFIQDYHDLYLKSDVLLLADVFENIIIHHLD